MFGIGKANQSYTADQVAARADFGNRILADAFPEIAAQWVSCSGTRLSLATPTNLICLSPKLQMWVCHACKLKFSKTVARHVDDRGCCPHCGQLPTARPRSKKPITNVSSSSVVIPPKSSNYKRAYDVLPSLQGRSIDPMLAREWLDVRRLHSFHDETLLASPKLDGIRCLVAFSPELNRMMYISRRGTLFECCESLDAHLLPLFKRDPRLMIDGELYTPLENFETLSSLVRTTLKGRTPEMRERQKDLQFHAFDIMYSKRIADPAKVYFPERFKLLKEIIPVPSTKQNAAHRFTSPRFQPLLHVPVHRMSQDAAETFLDKAIAGGYEGIMIRREAFPYGFGKRTNALMKYKKFDSEEYVVRDVVQGIGRCTGQAGSFLLKTKKGITFSATPRSDGPLRQLLWERRAEIIGQVVTVQFQGKSPDGVPRFPVAMCVRGASDGSNWF